MRRARTRRKRSSPRWPRRRRAARSALRRSRRSARRLFTTRCGAAACAACARLRAFSRRALTGMCCARAPPAARAAQLDEKSYANLVAKRRMETGGFVVGDVDGGCARRGVAREATTQSTRAGRLTRREPAAATKTSARRTTGRPRTATRSRRTATRRQRRASRPKNRRARMERCASRRDGGRAGGLRRTRHAAQHLSPERRARDHGRVAACASRCSASVADAASFARRSPRRALPRRRAPPRRRRATAPTCRSCLRRRRRFRRAPRPLPPRGRLFGASSRLAAAHAARTAGRQPAEAQDARREGARAPVRHARGGQHRQVRSACCAVCQAPRRFCACFGSDA